MLTFIIGLFLGAFLGIMVMALAAAAGTAERERERERWARLTGSYFDGRG